MGRVYTGVVGLWVVIGLFGGGAFGADEAAPAEPQAKTAPKIPAKGEKEKPLIGESELEALLKPLFKEELEVEAKAWMGYLRWKIQQIGNLEIARAVLTRKIDAAKTAADKVEEAKEAAEEAAEEAEEAAEEAAKTPGGASPDAGAEAEEAQKAAEEAQKAAEEATKAAEEAEQGGAEEDAGVDAAAEDALKRAAQKKAEEEAAEGETEEKPAVEEKPAEDETPADPALAKAATAAKTALEENEAAKASLEEDVVRLTEEQSAVIRRVELVLKNLEDKGGTVDDYRKYITAVRGGPKIDPKDASAVWTYVSGWLVSEEGGIRWAINIGAFLGILILFWVLSRIAGKGIDRSLARSRRASALLKSFMSKLVRRIILVVGFVIAMTYLEFNVGPILAIIGGASLVVAFALQDTLGNFASGILILLYRPFDVGDVIEAGGVSGKVDSMNLVSTNIKTFDNKSMIVPNNSVWGGVITNATGTHQRRVDMVFGIGYDDDIDKAQGILEEIVHSHELVLKDPEPVIQMHELADSSVNFVCRPWSRTADYWTVYWDITKQVKKRFDAEGVSIPFPQRDVHIYQETSGS